jgi:hypothetical protein
MVGLASRLGRIERKFPTPDVGAEDGCGTPDFFALSDDELDRLNDLIGRHVNLSGGEHAELEALCERVLWRR